MHFIYEKSSLSMKVITTYYYFLIPIYLQTYFIDSVGSNYLRRKGLQYQVRKYKFVAKPQFLCECPGNVNLHVLSINVYEMPIVYEISYAKCPVYDLSINCPFYEMSYLLNGLANVYSMSMKFYP